MLIHISSSINSTIEYRPTVDKLYLAKFYQNANNINSECKLPINKTRPI